MSELRVLQGKTTLIFFVAATLSVLLIAKLIEMEIISLVTSLNYSEEEEAFFRIWMRVALLIGVILPLGMMGLAWRDRSVRTTLGFYLVVLILQIITEEVLSSLFFPSIVVIIGMIYTIYRMIQLWEGHQWMKRTHNDFKVISLFWILLGFWSSNLAILFGIALPAIAN